MPLRREMMKKNKAALSLSYYPGLIFCSRPSPNGEQNEMIGIRKDYEASGGKCIEHTEGFDIFPGAWLTGPVPRKYPERNWGPGRESADAQWAGRRQLPEIQSLVLNTSKGSVVLTGSGTRASSYFGLRETKISQPANVQSSGACICFAATDEQLNWTGDKPGF